MLPDGTAPFHANPGILVDDQGHPHDLPRLIEEVLERVDTEVTGDVRRWLQRDFFPLHLKQYSKSRRKAPIYWPLSTASGSYTLWTLLPQPDQPDALYRRQRLRGTEAEAGHPRRPGVAHQGRPQSRRGERVGRASGPRSRAGELRETLLQIAPA